MEVFKSAFTACTNPAGLLYTPDMKQSVSPFLQTAGGMARGQVVTDKP